ncbi:MAG: DUF4395 domain-containing protein [Actinobacteria bacterium]|nr:DUF4395 domain-containing protein [Actinomycetota bacterium]
MTQATSKKVSHTTVTIDARGPRFSAAITVVVLSIALITNSIWVLAFQALVFGIGALRGPQFTPYSVIFRKFVRPRLKGEVPTEDVRPPKFAQTVGLVFALVGIAGLAISAPIIFTIATSAALAAAFLNAAFNYCLGCEIYLLLLRLR